MSLWGELKRRNVVRTGVAYLVAAWVLIQIVSVVLPTFDAPAWVVPTITFLLILAFPAVLLIAWAYEITPEGIRPAASVLPDKSIATETGQRLNCITSGLLVIAIGFVIVDNFILDGTPDERTRSNATSAAENSSAAGGNETAILATQSPGIAERIESHEPDEGFYSLMIIRNNVIGHPMLDEPRIAALRSRLGQL